MPRGGARPTSPGDLIRRKQARLRRAAEQRGEAPAEASTQTSTPVTAPAAERNRARVWRDFIRPRGGQVVVGIILFVTGLGLVMGLKAGQQEADFATMSREELIGVLDTLNADERSLSSEIEQLQLTKAQLESGVDSARVADEEAARRLATMRILAGTAPATGPESESPSAIRKATSDRSSRWMPSKNSGTPARRCLRSMMRSGLSPARGSVRTPRPATSP